MPSAAGGKLGQHEIADGARAERAQGVGVAIERVAAEIETQRILLVRQQFHLGPRRRVRQADQRKALLLVPAAEEIRLAILAIALRAAAMLDGAVDGREQPGAPERRRHAGRNQRVARAGLDERLEHALVDEAEIELFAELLHAT